MKISYAQTEGFQDYAVIKTEEIKKPWYIPEIFWRTPRKYEIELDSILEADDVSGFIVQQLKTAQGEPIFTNGIEDIVIENSVKIFLLAPGMRQAFFDAGYRPKTITQYENNIKIINRNPTIKIAMAIGDSQTTELEKA